MNNLFDLWVWLISESPILAMIADELYRPKFIVVGLARRGFDDLLPHSVARTHDLLDSAPSDLVIVPSSLRCDAEHLMTDGLDRSSYVLPILQIGVGCMENLHALALYLRLILFLLLGLGPFQQQR